VGYVVPEYSFVALGFSDLVVAGPDPFASNSRPESDAYGVTTLQVAPDAAWSVLTMTDDDGFLEDGDGDQELTKPLAINGMQYGIGQSVEVEYSYVIRPVGSNNPADNITIYVLEFGTRVQGIASSQLLARDVTYRIISGANGPQVPYGNLVICFTPGTAITTPGGPVAVDLLRPGDLVCTVDNGPQPVTWMGHRVTAGAGAAMPVQVAAGVLGNARALLLSQQHRVSVPPALGLGPDVITPVKGLVGLPGVTYAPQRAVTYIHLMCNQHELIFAEGAQTESFLPGPQAIKALSRHDRATLRKLISGARSRQWHLVRPSLRAGQVQRAMAHAGLIGDDSFAHKQVWPVLPPRNIAPGSI
jgi:hypothetical protein